MSQVSAASRAFPEPPFTPELIADFHAGALDEALAHHVQQRLPDDPEAMETLAALDATVEALRTSSVETVVPSELRATSEATLARLELTSPAVTPAPVLPSGPAPHRRHTALLAVAAMVTGVLAAGIGIGVLLLPRPTSSGSAGEVPAAEAAVLLAAASWVVVPMFQITAAYPQRFTTLWAPAVTATLVLWTLAEYLAIDAARFIAILALGLLGAGYAGTTLYLQAHSRRSKPDTPFLAFREAMYSALAGVLVLAISLWSDADCWPILAGVLILHGGFGGTITAMLYKIVPFLAWLHLTQAGLKAPNMKKLLPDTPIRRQLRVRTTSLATLCVAVFVPVLAPLAGVVLAVEFGWLFANLLRVVRARRDAAKNAGPRPGSHASA